MLKDDMISLYKSNLRIDAIVKLEKYFQKGNTQGQQGGGEPKGSSSMVPWKGLGKGKGKGKGKAKLEEGDQTTSKGHKKRGVSNIIFKVEIHDFKH